MKRHFVHKGALGFYNLLWNLAIPILHHNSRLKEGFEQRTLTYFPKGPADLWIQAASAGEAYLAWELIKRLSPPEPIRVLLTSTQRQGVDILERAVRDISTVNKKVTAISAYFPFDKPVLMRRAMERIRPQVVILLETELWPGLLDAIKKFGCHSMIINGRISNRSLRRYQVIQSFWHRLRPDTILAISEEDAQRFEVLFGKGRIRTMPNIKFDRESPISTFHGSQNPIEGLIDPDTPFIVFGSVRSQEARAVAEMIKMIRRETPQAVVGLFPRHLHRLSVWKTVLERFSITWEQRSNLNAPPKPGMVLLWDTFGELPWAYAAARAVYVGGTLAPLGGQNFLEALSGGVSPVIGPHWENFKWIGSEIVTQGLVRQVNNWKDAAGFLIKDIQKNFNRAALREEVQRYIKQRQGGAEQACQVIYQHLNWSR